MIISTSDFLMLLGCHWRGKGRQCRSRECRNTQGDARGAFSPWESTHSVLDLGWCAKGLHKSLSPLARQDIQPGAHSSSLTVHMDLVWPHETQGDQISLLALALEKQTRGGSFPVWGLLGILFLTFSVSSRRNTDFQPT